MPLELVPARPLRRRISGEIALTLAANAAGIGKAGAALARFKPDMVIATGGYVVFPVMMAARTLRLGRMHAALALLEENARPGLTNRLLGPLVDEVWTAAWTSPDAFKRKAVVTGIPVRDAFKTLPPRPRARERLQIDPHATVVVVLGGSQGARSINEATLAMMTRRALPSAWWILHISGERDYAILQAGYGDKQPGNRYTVIPYLDDPSTAYAAADLIVARAGASTLAELAVTGRPSLLIPYPFASENHQAANARFFAESGAARVLHDAELSGDVLFWALTEALDAEKLAAMAKCAAALAPGDAAAMIVRRVRALCEGSRAMRSEAVRP